MARPSSLSPAEIEEGKQLKADGHTWQGVANALGVSLDIVKYHCAPNRKEKHTASVRKYQKENYDYVRKQQREYARRLKIQQKKS